MDPKTKLGALDKSEIWACAGRFASGQARRLVAVPLFAGPI
jgi:hypothetical protein